MPAPAAITRSMRAGCATRKASGARPRRRSTGTSRRRQVFDPDAGVYGRWFTGGVCNTCYNAIDRHVERGPRRAARDHLRFPGRRHEAHHHLSPTCRSRPRCSPRILRNFGVAKGDRVILYMPMVPEAVFAMLACARIGAIHSVVFGGFAAKELATRIDDAKPKLILSACCGIEAARVVPYKPLLDEAIELADAQARGLPHPAAPAGGGGARRRPRPRLGDAARRGARVARSVSDCVPVLGDRPALHPLHLGHDRHPEGRGARQRRPHGRAQLVDAEPLRRRARRGLLGGLRHRLGGRPLLHRLRAAVARLHHRSSTRASRSARPTPARSGASSPSTAASRCSPRRPRSARSRRKTRRASCSRTTTCRNSARCSSPASAPIPPRSNGPSSC